ncbi:MAG: radical SAM protein [Lachnospiraceae bacterium]|nr:radical SAM protein [Lachnospiraceae bacterium]
MEKATPYSNLKVFAHAKVLAKIAEGEQVAPIYIRIKPTNHCNHKCYYCCYADSSLGLFDSVNAQDQIPWPKMKEIIADMSEIGVKAVTFSGGGEPLVYPYIVETMQEILDAGIDLSIITNGQLLKGERAKVLAKAKWVRISLDSSDAETYAKVRNVPLSAFREVCENIHQFSSIKQDGCELGVNFVVNHENAAQVYEMAKMVKSLGANHIKYAARVTSDVFAYHTPFRQKVTEQIHRAKEEFEDADFQVIDKYEGDFDSALVFHRCYEKCYINRLSTVIAADSKVYFCHDKAYVSESMVGDLKECSFKELWFSKETEKRYQEFNAKKECNHHCIYDDRNELLNTYFSLEKNHVNFI